MMDIGTVAKESGLSPKTIRFYESIGLIPSADRRPNGYRTYSNIDLHALCFINGARSLGFSVDEVRDLLDLWRDKTRTSAVVKTMASRQLRALDVKITELRSMHRTLGHLIERCQGDDRPDCPILDDLGDWRTRPGIGRNGQTGPRRRGRSLEF